MTKAVYKKSPWIIPIEQVAPNTFNTGQQLTFDKMIGKTALTEEEKSKYPFVIDPTGNYRVPDRQSYDVSVDQMGVPVNYRDYAMYKLILNTGEFAEDKIKYDLSPMKYVGYFYDKESEAVRYNAIDDLRYEAETLIRESNLDTRKRVAMLLNYKMPDKEFFINLKSTSDDILKRELVKASREHPELLMSCFQEKNPGIEKEIFIVELLFYGLIQQKPDGDIYSGTRYLGNSIDDVVKSLSKFEMQGDMNKWGIQLSEMKGNKPIHERMYAPPSARDGVNMLSPIEQFEEHVARMKAAILDEDPDAAIGYMTHIKRIYPEVIKIAPKYPFEFVKYEDKIAKLQIAQEKVLNSQEIELNGKTLEELQAKIKHHMTPYKKEDCVDFWNDKDKLIQYMISIR